jgi:alpha-galactosidase
MKTSKIQPNQTKLEDMELIRTWTGNFSKEPENLPISFDLNGKRITGIPNSWNPQRMRRRIDANLIETIFESREPNTGLTIRVEGLEYLDYPVVEWTAWFTNQGEQPTGLLSNIQAFDKTIEGASPVLYHCNGDFYSETGYTPEETPVNESAMLLYTPNGGRPSDGAFPYYRLSFKDCGLTLAIGWPGQWAAQFKGTRNGVHIIAGQEKTHLCLQPGEKIRTPRITLLAWTGDQTRAVNLWRRWYLAHVLPRTHGQPLQPKLAVCGPEDGEEFTAATEVNQLENIDKFVRYGFDFDVWWIDAGWYPCYNENHERRWWNTGTWIPDPERFPNGMRPVSEHAALHGTDLLVWFEPERVRPGSWLAREHPDWLLRSEKDDNSLLNLGDPIVRQWLTDHVDSQIKNNGIKIYRQDFNFPILDHWRSNDAEDRQGMNENLHVQGYLQFWDDLLERNPGLWIDSCSSGGRRNDLETMRRSVPLHYTDYGYGNHPIKLAFHRTLFEWIPYFKESTLSWDLHGNERFDDKIDSFSFHCAMAAMLFVTLDIRRGDYDYKLAVRLTDLWRKVADLIIYGDYYPHTPFHKSPSEWVAWQFDMPDEGRGMVQAIRLPDCNQDTLDLKFKGLDENCEYRLENPESKEIKERSGADLIVRGLRVTIPPRSGAIWIYNKI